MTQLGVPTDSGTAAPERKATRFTKHLKNVLTSESFLEKVALLCVTVILSGLAVPLVLAYVNAANTEAQKRVDAARARQESQLRASEALLNEFTNVALTYQTLALDVSFLPAVPAMHVEAIRRYTDRIGGMWARWRALHAQATIHASQTAAREMADLLNCAARQDRELIVLINNPNVTRAMWDQQHGRNVQMVVETNAAVRRLAADLGLGRDPSGTGIPALGCEGLR